MADDGNPVRLTSIIEALRVFTELQGRVVVPWSIETLWGTRAFDRPGTSAELVAS